MIKHCISRLFSLLLALVMAVSLIMSISYVALAQGPPPPGPPGPANITESDLIPPPETPANANVVYLANNTITTAYSKSDNVALDFSNADTGVYEPNQNSYVYLQNIYQNAAPDNGGPPYRYNVDENIDAPTGVYIFYTPGTHCFLRDSSMGSANGTFKLKSGGILTPLTTAATIDNEYAAVMAMQGGLLYGEANKIYQLSDASNYNYETNMTPEIYDGMPYNQPFYYNEYGGPLSGLTLNVPNTDTDTSVAFARFGSNFTLSNSTCQSYSQSAGPFQGGNFFGQNSAFLADSCATLNLNNISYKGTANAVYSVFDGKVNVNGGDYWASHSGSHGLYVASRGEIDANPGQAGSTDRTDLTDLTTIDEASTALATDQGGGVINAYNVVAKAYGLRSAGVYSIGAGQGDINVYDSKLTSGLDAGLMSASGGSIYADNSIIQGVFGIKTGMNSGTGAEVTVKNSLVTAKFDPAALQSVGYTVYPTNFDPTDPAYLNSGTGGKLSIFVDKAHGDINPDSYYYWFGNPDGSNKYVQAPGYSGGGTIGVIYTDNSSTPIHVISSLLKNENYTYSLANGGAAKNYLISSENGGTANVIFQDCNSQTKWDTTGEFPGTTEINGDFWVAKNQTYTDMMGTHTGDSYLNVTLQNSQWTGTIDGNGPGTNITMDADSSWNVTDDTTVGNLDAADYSNITANKPVKLYYVTLTNPLSGVKENADGSYTIGNVTYDHNCTLDVNTIGQGNVTVDPEQDDYNVGDSVTLTAVPAPGWEFSGWQGEITGNNNPATVVLSGGNNITAVFIQPMKKFTVNNIIVNDARKDNRGTINMNASFTIPKGAEYNLSEDPVTFGIGAWNINIPAGSFVGASGKIWNYETTNGNEPKINVKINFATGQVNLSIQKAVVGIINKLDTAKVTFSIGDIVGSSY